MIERKERGNGNVKLDKIQKYDRSRKQKKSEILCGGKRGRRGNVGVKGKEQER